MRIHPLAVVHPAANLGRDVVVGPFSIIEEGVTVGDGCILESHVIVKTGTRLGPNNHVFEGAVLGGLPQHLRMPEKVGTVVIGANNIIREQATVHRAMEHGHATFIGDNNFLMVGIHVAHDCRVGNNTIFANGAMLGGHVMVEDRAYISGNVGIHQFCRVGRFAMVGSLARVVQDIPPYVTIDGRSGCVVGLNTVGLRRNGFSHADITQLKAAYRVIYRSNLTWNEVLEQLRAEFSTGPAAHYAEFFSVGSRGIVHERRMPPRSTLKISEETRDEAVLRIRAG